MTSAKMTTDDLHALDAALAKVRSASNLGRGLTKAVREAKAAGATAEDIEKAIKGLSWG